MKYTSDIRQKLIEELVADHVLPVKREDEVTVLDLVEYAREKGGMLSNGKARRILEQAVADGTMTSRTVVVSGGKKATAYCKKIQ